MDCPQPQPLRVGLGCFPFARRYLGNRLFFLFLRVLRCFSSPGVPPCTYLFSTEYQMLSGGFPHSEICGSRPICGYPQLIAAYHVLHRLLVPRHPPCALISLILSRLPKFEEFFAVRLCKQQSCLYSLSAFKLNTFRCLDVS